MDFDDILCFLKVAEEGSFVQAAAQLGMSAPTVTRRIQRLEDHFKSTFFVRSRDRIALTHAGHTFLDYAISLADTIQSASEEFNLGSRYRPRLRIGAVSSVLSGHVAPVVERVQRRFPNAKIEIFDAPSRRIQDMLEANSIDIALTYAALDEHLHVTVPIARDPFVIIEPEGSQGNGKQIRTLEDLTRLNSIAPRRGGGVRMLIERYLRELNLKIEWDFEVQNLFSVMSLVTSGLGWGIVPVTALATVDMSRLRIVNLPEFNLTRNIYAIRIDHFEMNAASRYMWECLVETASDGGAGQQEGRSQPDPTD